MLSVLSAIVAVCAMPLGIELPVINIRLDCLNGPTIRPIPGGWRYMVIGRRSRNRCVKDLDLSRRGSSFGHEIFLLR